MLGEHVGVDSLPTILVVVDSTDETVAVLATACSL